MLQDFELTCTGRYSSLLQEDNKRAEISAEDGNWYVSLIDNNHLKFVFRETPVNPDLDFVLENDFVKICAKSKNKIVETRFVVIV